MDGSLEMWKNIVQLDGDKLQKLGNDDCGKISQVGIIKGDHECSHCCGFIRYTSLNVTQPRVESSVGKTPGPLSQISAL